VPVGGVVSEGAERKVAVEAGRVELQPGAALDVAGQESEDDVRLPRQPFEELRNTGFGDDGLGTKSAAKLLDVAVEDPCELGLEPAGAHGLLDQLAENLRVGLSGEIVPVRGPIPP